MEVLERHQGYEICRTSDGQIVIVDPRDPPAVRLQLFELLLGADALDALFFPSIEAARRAIEDLLAIDEARGTDGTGR